MQKSVPIRVVRAALERHNKQVDRQVHLEEQKIQVAAEHEIAPTLEKANALLAQVDEMRKALKKDGWETSFEGMYGREKLKLDASLSKEKVHQRLRAAKVKLPRKMSENDLILAISATGEDDIAKALDNVKVLWRPTRGPIDED